MDSWEFALTLVVGLALFYFFDRRSYYQKFPPGPWGIPLLGYMPFLMFRDPVKVFNRLKEKYGKVFTVRLGNFNVVVLNDFKVISEAYNKEVFCGRPGFEIQMWRNHGQKRGILLGDGRAWSEQRRHVIRNLRNFGFGKHATMESLLAFEAQELITQFDANIGRPFNMRNTLNASVLNSLWIMCTGSRFDINDATFKLYMRTFTENLSQLHPTGMPFFFPWILNGGVFMRGTWKGYQKSVTQVQDLVRAYIDEHRATFDPTVTRDLIDTMLAQQQKTVDPTNSFYGKEGDLNMLLDLNDLFLAGGETTSTTLQFAIKYLIAYPEIQAKLHEEIDRVIGARLPALQDRSKMLYLEATLLETLRHCSLLPLALAHNTYEATEIDGYTIPKNTVIFANIRHVHFDPTYWKDPETFDPSRFIDPVTQKLIKHEAFLPFSTGKRQCLGMELAKETLFIFFTTLLQKYTFAKDPAVTGPLDLEPSTKAIIVSPKPYNVYISHRIPTPQ